MKFFPIALIVVGIATMAALVLHFGAGAVVAALLAVGFAGYASVTLIHTGMIALMGLAWWVLLPETKPWVAIWGRFVRDSGSEVLPLSQVGGYVLGTRALACWQACRRHAARRARSSTSRSNSSASLAYTALGLVWLLHLQAHGVPPQIVVLGLVVASWSVGARLYRRAAPRDTQHRSDRALLG